MPKEAASDSVQKPEAGPARRKKEKEFANVLDVLDCGRMRAQAEMRPRLSQGESLQG